MHVHVEGTSIIAGTRVTGGQALGPVKDPTTGRDLAPQFTAVDEAGVHAAATAAAEALSPYRTLPREQRATFLEHAADNLDAAGGAIITRSQQETGLTEQRLRGELARTSGQLRLFAEEVRMGGHLGVRIDHGQPDLRLRRIPIGPVAVFGASNFPLAFSTAGGDTASALAAGCPVVVKAHAAHAGTAELAATAITSAAQQTGMPAGVFSMIHGPGRTIGRALATHPAIRAVAFTGSQTAGTALMQAAADRDVPIPVFAEMSSINPAIVLPQASRNANEVASGFVGSLTLGAGQFCTNPGLLFVPTDAADLIRSVGEEVGQQQGQVMLTEGIRAAYQDGVARLARLGLQRLAAGQPGPGENAPAPAVFTTDLDTLAAQPDVHEEVFGAAAIIVTYEGIDRLATVLASLPGQLTATLQVGDEDSTAAGTLLPVLEGIAGRIIVNGWPTGVAVTHAMVHGGPFPATSDARVTSVGTLAIDRFLRPVSYQDVPDALLPPELRDDAGELPRRVDGQPVQ